MWPLGQMSCASGIVRVFCFNSWHLGSCNMHAQEESTGDTTEKGRFSLVAHNSVSWYWGAKGSIVASENHKKTFQSAYPSYYIITKKLDLIIRKYLITYYWRDQSLQEAEPKKTY